MTQTDRVSASEAPSATVTFYSATEMTPTVKVCNDDFDKDDNVIIVVIITIIISSNSSC